MREYNRVSPRFWTEAQVEQWTDPEKILGLYLLTCEARTTEGIFRLTWQTVSGDLDWPLETVTATASKLFAKGFLKYDETARVVFLPNALKYQRPDNDNQVKGAVRSILALPRTPLIADFVSAANQHCRKLFEALSEPLANRYPNSFEYSNSNSNSNSNSKEEHSSDESAESSCLDLEVVEGEVVEEPSSEDLSFSEFWNAYPRREARVKARTAWKYITGEERTAAVLVAQAMARLFAEGRVEKRYIPHPATFLHQKRWEDWRDGVPAGWERPGAARSNQVNSMIADVIAGMQEAS